MHRIALVAVALTLAAPALAQPPEPVEVQRPQGAVGPRYEPTVSFLAGSLCEGQDKLLDDWDRLVKLEAPLTPTNRELYLFMWTSFLAEQTILSALMEDARVQDPSFQCYFWDFEPDEGR